MEILKKVSLSKYCTFGIGGQADYLCVAKSEDELIEGLRFAKNSGLKYRVIGHGSNVLFSDNGYRGLIIINKSSGYTLDGNVLTASSGASLIVLVAACIKSGLGGLEFASGIPGSIGGAIVGNAGAYGQAVGDALISAKVYINGSVEKWENKDFEFKYRYSSLRGRDDVVLISAKFMLTGCLTEDHLNKIKSDNLRRATSYLGRNVGSYFKNINISQLNEDQVIKLNNYVYYEKVVTGKLIEALSLKGYKIGGAAVSEHHGNVINNTGSATSLDIEHLEKYIVDRVKLDFGVMLEPEVVKITP